jgi:hypothetical protein
MATMTPSTNRIVWEEQKVYLPGTTRLFTGISFLACGETLPTYQESSPISWALVYYRAVEAASHVSQSNHVHIYYMGVKRGTLQGMA